MIVIILRHADKVPPPDDALSPKGCERARLLARMLKNSGVTAGFRSESVRAAQTLKPLEDELGAALSVTEVPRGGSGGDAGHVQGIAAALRALPAKTVAIVVSHSETVGRIITALGGDPIESIAADQFDRLFVLFVPPSGAGHLLELRYELATAA